MIFVLVIVAAVVQAACASDRTGAPPASTLSIAQRDAAARALVERGQTLLGRGDAAAAARALRQALALRPDLVDARAGLGHALYAMGDLDAAVDELRAGLHRSPDAVPLRLVLAAVLIGKQDWQGARAELEDILRARPDSTQAQYSLGLVRYALGDLAAAGDAYRAVLAVEPDHQDARYNLALVLKVAHRDAEAAREFIQAAEAGHPRAQYFAGAAYADGQGVERDLAAAIRWWLLAAEQGVTPAREALARLRLTALGRGRRSSVDRDAAAQAFREYRGRLWREFPELTPDGDATVGEALLRVGRVHEAVVVLIREASALSEPAQRLLEKLYADGVDGQLPAHDARIQGYLEAAAAETPR